MNATGRTITVVATLALLVAAVAPATAVATGDESAVEAPTDGAGPPTDRPGPVPGFVEEILGAIGEFLADLTPGEPATDRPAVAEGG